MVTSTALDGLNVDHLVYLDDFLFLHTIPSDLFQLETGAKQKLGDISLVCVFRSKKFARSINYCRVRSMDGRLTLLTIESCFLQRNNRC